MVDDYGSDAEYFDDGSFIIYYGDGSSITYDTDGNIYQVDGGGQAESGLDAIQADYSSPTTSETQAPAPVVNRDVPAPQGGLSGVARSLLEGVGNRLNTLGTPGAALAGTMVGGLLANAGAFGSDEPRRQPMDMSAVGRINPRETSFGMGPARQVTDYSGAYNAPDFSQVAQNLSAPPAGGLQQTNPAPVQMASGGSTHYTFGTAVDPMQNLMMAQPQQMKSGGLPSLSNVPMTGGRLDFREGSAVHGPGDGQSDDIPALLADGEYVIDAETVAQIGNGSTKAGAAALDKFRENIRSHKRSAPVHKIPPKTKPLTSYLKKGD